MKRYIYIHTHTHTHTHKTTTVTGYRWSSITLRELATPCWSLIISANWKLSTFAQNLRNIEKYRKTCITIMYQAFHVRNLPTWKKWYQAPLKHWYDICVKTFSPFVWPLFHLHATLLAEINVPEKVPLRVYINDMYWSVRRWIRSFNKISKRTNKKQMHAEYLLINTFNR